MPGPKPFPGGIWTSSRFVLILLFCFSVVLILEKGAILVPERADQSMWDYMAQAILRGQVPYRDVVNIKTPLSAYLSAAAILGGKAVGIEPLLSVRNLGLLVAGALVVVTFLVTEAYTRSRLAA